jgi:hypothetical protein
MFKSVQINSCDVVDFLHSRSLISSDLRMFFCEEERSCGPQDCNITEKGFRWAERDCSQYNVGNLPRNPEDEMYFSIYCAANVNLPLLLQEFTQFERGVWMNKETIAYISKDAHNKQVEISKLMVLECIDQWISCEIGAVDALVTLDDDGLRALKNVLYPLVIEYGAERMLHPQLILELIQGQGEEVQKILAKVMKQTQPTQLVVVKVNGGVADVTSCPSNIRVVVLDFDNIDHEVGDWMIGKRVFGDVGSPKYRASKKFIINEVETSLLAKDTEISDILSRISPSDVVESL